MKRKISHLINSFVNVDKYNEFELRIRDFISENLNTAIYKWIRIILILAFILLFRNFKLFLGELRFVFIIILAAFVGAFVWLNSLRKKQKNNVYVLNRAINEIRNNNYSVALDYMLTVYYHTHDQKLWSIIVDFSEKYNLSFDKQNARANVNKESEKDIKKKDPKLFEIIKQIKTVADYISKHLNIIEKIRKKISDLKEQIFNTNENRLKMEYEKLIKRYNDIIELEKSKIDFYEKAQNELLKLKENHIVTQKLLNERQELEGLENSLLEKSIYEAMDPDMGIDEFICYESAYLEAIKEYSEPVSNSSDQNLFEDVILKFKDKTNLL